MVDFEIDFSGEKPVMTFEKGDALINNIFLSLWVKRGSFFLKPEFGSRLHTIRKIATNTLKQAKEYVTEALKWLTDLRRITDLEVVIKKDAENKNRINIFIQALKPDGNEITFSTFYSVV